MKFKHIVKVPDQRLHAVCEPFDFNTELELVQSYSKALQVCLKRQPTGIGLSLPQVGVLRRGFVLDPTLFTPSKWTFCFNPVVLSVSDATLKKEEGCLSIPGESCWVTRPSSCEVRYTNEHGEVVEQVLTALTARCFQHELDHLEGILITDKREAPPDPKSRDPKRALASLSLMSSLAAS
jgi:peptide deformylase